MKRSYPILAAVAAAASLTLAASVQARPEGPMAMGARMDCDGMGPGMHGGGQHARHDPEARLRELKAELKITPDQESAWQAFANQATAQATAMKAMFEAMRETMRQPEGSAPDRMARRTEMMKSRLAGMEAMTAAFKDLYAVLTPEQKALADQRFGPMRGRPGERAPRRG
ncbi:MAG: Spy/CpxP family protein refolding chaperone [Rhodocyclaceae bacterium]